MDNAFGWIVRKPVATRGYLLVSGIRPKTENPHPQTPRPRPRPRPGCVRVFMASCSLWPSCGPFTLFTVDLDMMLPGYIEFAGLFTNLVIGPP